MKVGDRVKVFQRPITSEDFEGIATVVHIHRKLADRNTDGKALYDCVVKFDNDPEGRLDGALRMVANIKPDRCADCRDGEHANYDDDIHLVLVRDPDTKHLVKRARMCAEHRSMYDGDGYEVRTL